MAVPRPGPSRVPVDSTRSAAAATPVDSAVTRQRITASTAAATPAGAAQVVGKPRKLQALRISAEAVTRLAVAAIRSVVEAATHSAEAIQAAEATAITAKP